MTPFVFISPLPEPLEERAFKESAIGPLTLSECVEFYWKLKSAAFSAQMQTRHSIQFEDEDEPYFEQDLSTDSYGAATYQNCIAALEPFKRACPEGVFYRGQCSGDYVSMFSIDGPYIITDSETERPPFNDGKFMFIPNIEVECGRLIISTRSETYSGGDYEKVGSAPYEIFGKIFNLNVYLPAHLAHPDTYTTFQYSYAASLSFDFH